MSDIHLQLQSVMNESITNDDNNELQSMLQWKLHINATKYQNRDLLKFLHEREIMIEKPNELINFAGMITSTNKAPKLYTPGLPLNGHPPAPQFHEMRNGYLEKLNGQSLPNT